MSDEQTEVEALGQAADEATGPTRLRFEVEAMQQANDATLARLGQHHGVAVDKTDIVNVRLQMLCDYLLGDMDAVPRLEYERLVQVKFTELIGDLESQVSRSKLLEGVRITPPKLPPNFGVRGQ